MDVAAAVAGAIARQAPRREPRPVNVHDYAPPLTPEEFARQVAKMERDQKLRGELADQAARERADARAAHERIARDGHTDSLEAMAREAVEIHEVRALGAFRPEPGELSMVREWRAWYRDDIAIEWLRKLNARRTNG